MGEAIKMIQINENDCIFLYGINKKGELLFRASRNIEQLQSEKPVIEKELCYTNLYHFHINYLKGLPILDQV